MLNKSLIFIILNHPLNWVSDYEKQTAKVLAEFNNTILFFRPGRPHLNMRDLLKRRKRFNVFEKAPIKNSFYVNFFHPLPYERFRLIYKLNQKNALMIAVYLAKLKFGIRKKTVIWVFNPEYAHLALSLKRLSGSRSRVVYDCIDYFSYSDSVKESKLRNYEALLLRRADTIVTPSQSIADIHRKIRPDITVTPAGFRLDDFRTDRPIPAKNSRTVGYCGAVNYRLDYGLLVELCRSLPKLGFVFIGPKDYSNHEKNINLKTQIENLLALENVNWIPQMPPSRLPRLMKNWKAGIIPYRTDLKLNKYCRPLKLMEYFYLGLQVVSSPLPEIIRLRPHVLIAANLHEWVQATTGVVNSSLTEPEIRRRRQLAVENSWSSKIKVISSLI